MKKYILLILCLVSGIAWSNNMECYNSLDKLKAVSAVMGRVSKRIAETYHISPAASGGEMMYEIKSIFLAFEVDRSLTIQEAQDLVVGALQIELEEINRDEKIRKYLAEYPYSPHRVEFSFYVNDEPPQITSVSYLRGLIRYKVHEGDTVNDIKVLRVDNIDDVLRERGIDPSKIGTS